MPKRKLPIAYSCKATSNFIVDLAEDGSTIQQIRDRFGKEFFLDDEAVTVLDAYITRGYGNIIAKEWFR